VGGGGKDGRGEDVASPGMEKIASMKSAISMKEGISVAMKTVGSMVMRPMDGYLYQMMEVQAMVIQTSCAWKMEKVKGLLKKDAGMSTCTNVPVEVKSGREISPLPSVAGGRAAVLRARSWVQRVATPTILPGRP